MNLKKRFSLTTMVIVIVIVIVMVIVLVLVLVLVFRLLRAMRISS